MAFQTPKGTRDFLPAEMVRRRRLFDIGRRIFEKYGYGEINTPAFENLELFESKGGIGGDAIKDIYRFEDKSGRKLALRFDPTTPIARIVASQQLQKPIKWYYNFYPSWRYEDTKKGRYRELYQSGAELIGTGSEEADAEIVRIVIEFVREAGLKDFYVRVNSRKILDRIADKCEIEQEKRSDIFRALDKLDKKGERLVRKELKKLLSDKQANKLFTMLEQEKGEELQGIISLIPAKLRKYVKFDASIARGLDYYTGFIFETIVKGKEDIGSIASGGRYDTLIEKFGGQKTPAVGVGIGVDRILDLLPEKTSERKLVYVISVSDSARAKVREIVDKLRKSDINADMDIMGRNFSNQMKYAGSNTGYVIIVGENEIKEKKVKLKDMKTGKEKKTSVDKIVKEIKSR